MARRRRSPRSRARPLPVPGHRRRSLAGVCLLDVRAPVIERDEVGFRFGDFGLGTQAEYGLTTGIVTEVNVEEGQPIKRGAVLFKLDDRADRANLDKARAQLAKDKATQADIERQRQMAINSMGDQAQAAHAYGGSRHGVADALTNEAAFRQGGLLSAQLRSQGFTTALGAAQNENQFGYQYPLARQGLLKMPVPTDSPCR